MTERLSNPNELPQGFRLLPDETLIQAIEVPPRIAPLRSSAIREIYRLTNASSPKEVGAFGPAIASLAFEGAHEDEHQQLYSVVFGRDSLRVALDLIEYYPRLAEATIRRLAETQGTEFNATREEEPGRIAHEIRAADDPHAKHLTETRGWGWPYYGSVDATPEFIRTLAAYTTLHDDNTKLLFESFIGKNGEPLQIRDSFERAVNWIETRLQANPEGIIEFKKAIPLGTENQVWKDSPDAYHHANGDLANHQQGVSSVELEAVTHDALLDAADIFERHLDNSEKAANLRERANRLKQTIRSQFWTNDKGGYFVLGTDRDDDGTLRQLKVRTSNMGHLFNTRVLDGDDEESRSMRQSVLRQLQSDALLAASGVRTLANDEVRFREGAYHNGSVWIWDTHHIAKGARRHAADPGFSEFAYMLDTRVLATLDHIGGFPEYARGGNTFSINSFVIDVLDNRYNFVNRVEQPPQEIQAWTVSAAVDAKHAIGKQAIRRAAPPVHH